MKGQLQLDLFPVSPDDFKGRWRRWLVEVNGVNEEGLEVFDRLVERYGISEAAERSKALRVLHGKRRVAGLTADDLGLFTASDYHTVWDRAWAAQQGCDLETVRRMTYWDYGRKQPIVESV